MKSFKYVCIFLLVIAASSHSVSLAGNVRETQNRAVKNFDAIKVSSGIDLFLSMGTEETLKVIADDDVIDDVITEVKKGTLHIYMKKKDWPRFFNWGATQSRKVYVTVKELSLLSASSGSDVKSEGTLTGKRLEVSASSGSDVVLDVNYKSMSLDSSSGSDLKVSGKAKTVKASASSGSDIIARDLKVATCHASASSGSDISIHVTREIHASASSGADIRYYGKPGVKEIDESSGGDVTGR